MTLPRLSETTLAALPPTVARPAYDLRRVRAGVVHLGLGAFQRAHQAPVFERLLAAGHAQWGVVGVGVRSVGLRDALAAQDGLYSLAERDGAASRLSVCGAIRDVLVAAESPERVVAALANPSIQLVTLTLTEKGYDAAGPIWPLLGAALARRRELAAPLTIASCDNLAGNGDRAKAAALAATPDLRDWIETACAFPNSMVDRITPATTEADLAAAEAALGLRDEAAVVTEPFWQWVIEDRFAGARPPLELAGVQAVIDVAPFERAKLRLLNAAHSTLAYAGLLAGFQFVHEAIAWPPLRQLVERLWDEAAETLSATPGLDIAAYRAALLRRFDNPALAHRLAQIAEDGSRKLPQRLLATLAERRRHGRASPAILSALGAWQACVVGRDDLIDPALATLKQALRQGGDGFDAMVAAGMIDDAGWIDAALRAELAAAQAAMRGPSSRSSGGMAS